MYQLLRPNESRGIAAKVLIISIMVLNAVALLNNLFLASYFQNSAKGISLIPRNWLPTYEMLFRNMAFFTLFLYCCSGIVFIMWFRRAYYNISMCVDSMDYGDGWAAGAWFVPILNLFRPYQMMAQMHVETQDYLQKKLDFAAPPYFKSIAGWWWTLYIVHGVTNYIETLILRSAQTSEILLLRAGFGVFTEALAIVLGIVTIKMIANYMKSEALLPAASRAKEPEVNIEKMAME